MSEPFSSVEEAYAFIKSHEIATSNRYVVAKSKGINTQDVTALNSFNIQWEYTPGVKPGSEKIDDGIPFINIGTEMRNCQYGPPRKRLTEGKVPPLSPRDCCGKKRRVQSKKLNCPSKLKIKKIMKFPEYAVEVGKEYPCSFKSELGKQLKANFDTDTKRYIQVYVHIDNNHNHGDTPMEVQPKYKNIVHAVDKGCTRISAKKMPKRSYKKGTVLKKWASLKGKNLMDLAMQFKTMEELPKSLAQPNYDQKLEDMKDEELLSLYHDITGEVPNNMFSMANKEFTSTNLCLLLHLSIMFANAAGDECAQLQAHHSVRIKGTENNFTPVQCLELDCAIIGAHMHCPLCCKTDCYTDPNLLKGHFKNRHVDKAIEFSGLRILRCYDNCEITGKNKECKTFNGGHWHCYKCRNGLDKRHCALAHYQSHLKNHESSFQIQVSQDVNAAMYGYTVPHEINVTQVPLDANQPSISLNSVSSTAKPSCSSSSLKRSYADAGLETVDDTAMFVQDDCIGNVTSTYTAQEIPAAGNETYVITMPDNGELNELRNKVREFEMNCKDLEKKNMIQRSLIEFLQMKDSNQTKMLDEYEIENQDLLLQIDTYKSENQDLLSQIDSYKTELTELKSTIETPSIAADKDIRTIVSTAKHQKKSRTTKKTSISGDKDILSTTKNHKNQSRTTGQSEHVSSEVDVSLNKAKELEKRIKDREKESLVPGHSYGTRRATRKISTTSTSKDVPGVTKISKQNEEKQTGSQNDTVTGSQNETVTGSQKETETSGTSQIGTMEEMFNQLSTMRREIDLLKQTTFVKSDASVQQVCLQPPVVSVSDINNPSSSVANTSVFDINNPASTCNTVANTSVFDINNPASTGNTVANTVYLT